ncbi:MAG TPA: hypothetical protein VH413_15710 [Verrucomicrobiae bacterium]|nr:hypothetical protein [Verrucomicrobiae bacterium]
MNDAHPATVTFRYALLGILLFLFCAGENLYAEPVHAGFLYDSFGLTLAPGGHRTEILGPSYYSEQKDTQYTWAVPVLTLAHVEDPSIQYEEFDWLYPVLTYDRFGVEYRWQFFQLFSFAGGTNQDETGTRRFTLFPIYFQQRGTLPEQNYTAVVPFGGTLKHRLFRDEIDFVLFPFYAKTIKKDVVTYNMPYPFFHLRHGDGLHGWQAWPITGHEHKVDTLSTNVDGEVTIIGGHDSRFVLWPFYTQSTNDTDTNNPFWQQATIPFYSIYRSKLRDSTSWGWPIGVTHSIDREKKYTEWDAPWPLVEFSHGSKITKRVWPFFNQSHNQFLEDDWYLWPVYKYNRLHSPPVDRDRTRILFFLYSSINEKSLDDGRVFHRQDFLPFYNYRHELNGNERLQILSILEPFFPNNKSIERDYSPLWSLWVSQHNPKTGARSQSLLWNLYRHESAPQVKKTSLLFGLFQYESTLTGKHWRVCYIPFGKRNAPPAEPSPRH